ncbi:MAG TPA: type II toxin-antitoxin system RelE/ParE family toxin [Candidatus Acidoferrales bacterium]
MAWDVEYTDEFEEWWNGLSTTEQEDVAEKVKLLELGGPALGRPHADTLAKQSRHPNMKELRIMHRGDAYRVLFAFDPRRVAILLLGGRKPDQKWYKTAIPRADRLYDKHLEALKREAS